MAQNEIGPGRLRSDESVVHWRYGRLKLRLDGGASASALAHVAGQAPPKAQPFRTVNKNPPIKKPARRLVVKQPKALHEHNWFGLPKFQPGETAVRGKVITRNARGATATAIAKHSFELGPVNGLR